MVKKVEFTLETFSPEETVRLGHKLASVLEKGDVISLSGQLGAGKTIFVKGVASGLEVKEEIVSPTFLLLRTYQGKLPLYHFDAYRIKNKNEFNEIGLEEFLFGEGVSVIEWGEKVKPVLPKEFLDIKFFHTDKQDLRKLVITANGQKWIDKLYQWRD